MDSVLSIQQRFPIYGDELKNVRVFQYLGWLLLYDNNDIQAVRGNLKKALGFWARILGVLQAENASPGVCVMFYMVTVQAVLRFASETGNLTLTTMK